MGAKRKATSNNRAAGLSTSSLKELGKKARKDPYGVFHECERRLAKEGTSALLARTAKAAAAAIENGLLSDATSPDKCMEFGSEFGVVIHIGDEVEEGAYQAIELLGERLKKFLARRR